MCLASYVLFTVLCVDEWRVIKISKWSSKDISRVDLPNETIRIVSLNCSTSSVSSCEEVLRYKPDIILYQESPSTRLLERVATKLYGKTGCVISTPDCSIVISGKVVSSEANPRLHYTIIKVVLKNGSTVAVVNTRLATPQIDIEFWRPSVWRAHASRRAKQRKQIDEVMKAIESLPSDMPVIVGGDFNVPANDGALDTLSSRLFDSFKQAGFGWGNTATNSWPVHRIDQIWLSRQFVAVRNVAIS